ncbi:MAG: hypothetical protein KF791_12340 [Verrucomicrobiae bacterium]|nr:hypothetical protein [Verrucomicrobiae bacterium]
MKAVVAGVASLTVMLFAYVEVVLTWPLPGWLYLGTAIGFAIALFDGSAPRRRVLPMAAFAGILALLHAVPWTSRKPFLKDLGRIRPGMTEAEVRRIMGRYLEGTGWSSPSGDSGTLTLLDSGGSLAVGVSPQGELALQESLVFRHSNSPRFNSDWGILTMQGGRVRGVRFSPD